MARGLFGFGVVRGLLVGGIYTAIFMARTVVKFEVLVFPSWLLLLTVVETSSTPDCKGLAVFYPRDLFYTRHRGAWRGLG